jgi:tRNA acetyltransferase TAN1
MVPSSDTCVANLPEVIALCRRIIVPFFNGEREGEQTYRIEMRIRNHTTINRQDLIQEIAKCIPPSYKVDLEKPAFFILVEVFKSVCGMSIVEDYYKYQKYNVMTLAQSKDDSREIPEGRVAKKARTGHSEVAAERTQA